MQQKMGENVESFGDSDDDEELDNTIEELFEDD